MIASDVTILIGSGFLDRFSADRDGESYTRVTAFGLFITGTAFFNTSCARRTVSGWKWRWGSMDQPAPHQASAPISGRR